MRVTFSRNAHWCNGLGYHATNFGGAWIIIISLLFWSVDISTGWLSDPSKMQDD